MADYTQLWDTVLIECGESQQEMADYTGISQPQINTRLQGKTGSAAERWAVSVAAAALMGRTMEDRRAIVERARALKELADGA